MAWRLAASLTVYIGQINTMAPSRSKASDGTIGDSAHQGTNSDHNPRHISGLGSIPVVTAADITHDPARGCDFGLLAETFRVYRDHRIKYVIFNRRIFSSYATSGFPAWAWRPYNGDNPHTQHGHLSVVRTTAADNTGPWPIGLPMAFTDDADFRALVWRVLGVMTMSETVNNHVNNPAEVNHLALTLKRLEAKIDALAAQLPPPPPDFPPPGGGESGDESDGGGAGGESGDDSDGAGGAGAGDEVGEDFAPGDAPIADGPHEDPDAPQPVR